MASPLRFRYTERPWDQSQVHSHLEQPLDQTIGIAGRTPEYTLRGPWNGVRFDLDNGDVALFAYNDTEGYWMGNTETPQALWRTDKRGWQDVPYPVSRWAQRELLSTLHQRASWLRSYPHLSWYFLPVLMSKDGRESTRSFFSDHAAGFPDAHWRQGTQFVESILSSGFLDEDRALMAGKLGTSPQVDLSRMSAAISEFVAGWILVDSGHPISPEPQLDSGHRLDFVVTNHPDRPLIEVTRPSPPGQRARDDPVAAIKQTVQTKTGGQLSGSVNPLLIVDCSSFPQSVWATIKAQQPAVGYQPAIVYRCWPNGNIEGYSRGAVPLSIDALQTGQIKSIPAAE